MSDGEKHLKDEGSNKQVILAGATAGLISRFCIAPLDVVKIRLQLQVQPAVSTINKGAIRTAKNIVKEEGIRALWKGNVPAEFLYLLYGGAQFSTYHGVASLLRNNALGVRLPDAAESFVCGAVAGGVATATTYPLDLLRTRFAAQGRERVYHSLRACIRDIYRSEGPHGYFRGLGAGVGQVVPYMGLFFANYETLRVPLAQLHWAFGSGDAVAGVLAGILAKTGVFPLDLVRKRLQVQGPSRERYVYQNIPVYKGVTSTLRAIVRQEGWRGLYGGLTVSLVKAAPASAITMWTYGRALNVLSELDRE